MSIDVTFQEDVLFSPSSNHVSSGEEDDILIYTTLPLLPLFQPLLFFKFILGDQYYLSWPPLPMSSTILELLPRVLNSHMLHVLSQFLHCKINSPKMIFQLLFAKVNVIVFIMFPPLSLMIICHHLRILLLHLLTLSLSLKRLKKP